MTEGKSRLHEVILNQAYNHPKYAAEIFKSSPTTCRNCACEYVSIIEDTGNQRKLLCQYCGIIFQDKDLVA